MNRLDARTWVTIIVTTVITAVGVGVLFWFLGDTPGVETVPFPLAIGIAVMAGGLVVGIILEATKRKADTDEPAESAASE